MYIRPYAHVTHLLTKESLLQTIRTITKVSLILNHLVSIIVFLGATAFRSKASHENIFIYYTRLVSTHPQTAESCCLLVYFRLQRWPTEKRTLTHPPRPRHYFRMAMAHVDTISFPLNFARNPHHHDILWEDRRMFPFECDSSKAQDLSVSCV